MPYQSNVNQYGTIIGDSNKSIKSTSTGTAGQVLTSNGVSADPTYKNATSTAAATVITTFDASGTWTKNANTKMIEVFIFGAGAGGGSGRKGASGAAGGGGSGTGGQSSWVKFPSSFFAATESVVIGTGGAGGAAQTTDSTNGSIGVAGTITSIGSLKVLGGNPGGAGINGSANGGSAQTALGFVAGRSSSFGSNGQLVSANTALDNDGSEGYNSGTGGGGGAGADTVTERSGGAGSSWIDLSSNVIIAGGTAGLESTGIAGGNGNPSGATGGFFVGGTGGGGGGGYSVGANGATTGGNGGNGGLYGGGGGGGGGGIDAVANSGAGGNGDNGRVIVIEYF